MVSKSSFTRRRYLKRTAAMAAGAVAAPTIVPASALAADKTAAPSNRIAFGLIGCGGHGAGWNLNQIFRYPDAQVIAVCDVDKSRRLRAKEKVEKHYSKLFGRQYKGCAAYGDFRDLINRKDIDAVANCTPDHWHVIPSIMAARCGKDVICEKPLTLTVAERRTLCEATKETGCIFQTASENRSIDTYIQICELVRNGRIGKLRHIEVTLPTRKHPRIENST